MDRPRTSSVVAAMLALCLCAATAEERPNVTLLVHDYSGLSASLLQATEEQMRLVFAHAGVELHWAVCRENPQRPVECDLNAEPGRFTLRILARYPGGWLKHGNPLGSANTRGFYASVYADEIRTTAAAKNIEFETLLAYAGSHEVGHLLIGPGHSHSGIMQRSWDRLACHDMSQRWLAFNAQERDRMQRTLKH